MDEIIGENVLEVESHAFNYCDIRKCKLSIINNYAFEEFSSLEKLEDGLKKNQNIPLRIIDMYIDYYNRFSV